MTKTKSTKRALLLSALSLLLCVSMLIGSTFAWFTDSVTSGSNKIVAGNLKVDLLMADADGNYASIANKDAAIFGANSLVAQNNAADTLWEPGKTQIVYLGVENKGNLDMKYNILLNVIDGGLIGALEYAVVDGANAKTNPITATKWADIKANAQTGNVAAGSTVAAPNGAIKAGEDAVDYFALAIHMKEEAGNDYMGKDITIDVTVLATQLTSEFDSFDNQYDKAAAWDGKVPEEMPDTLVVDGATQTVHVKDAAAFAYLSTLSAKWADFYTDGNGRALSNYKNNAGANYYYSGQWTISLEADINLMNYPIAPVKIVFGENCGNSTFDGNDHTISNINTTSGLFANNNRCSYADIKLANVVVNTTENLAGALTGVTNGGANNIHVVNANVNGAKYVGGIAGKIAGNITNCSVKNSTVTGTDKTVGGLVGYSIGDPNAVTVTGNTVDNVTVAGAWNVGGLLGQAQNETVENNTVKNATVISTTELPADVDANEVRAAEIAARSAFSNTIMGINTYENVTVKKGEVTSMGDSDKGVDVPEDVELPDDAKFVMTDPIIDEENKTVTIEDASFRDADGNEVDLSNNTTPITVTIKVPFADGETFDIKHDGEYITTAIVNDGKLVYECFHFCEIIITDAKMTAVSNADQLVAALEAGEDVIFTNDIKIDPANMSNAYGKTGINVKKGQTIDGNGFTLNIQGAGGTWDSGINTTGGIIRNIKVTGSFRGIFVNHNSDYSETVVLENVIIEGTTYTISCDQGMYQNLEAYNCTFNGWTSFAATLGTAKFVDCNFGEGKGYAYCRPYAPTTFVGCKFEAGYEVDTRAASTFEKCTLGGVDVTEDNLATLVTANIDKASVK